MDLACVLVANAKDGTIDSFALVLGRMHHLSTLDVGYAGLPLAYHLESGLVFCGTKDRRIHTLAVDRRSGRLRPIGQVRSHGAPTYLAATGSVLLAASYGDDLGEAWAITDSGLQAIGMPMTHLRAHCVIASDDERFCYLVSLGEDAIIPCQLNPDPSPIPGAKVSAPAGSGPRHMILDDTGRHAYVITEYSGQVLHYRRDPYTGTLSVPDQASCIADRSLAHSAYGRDPVAENLIWTADLHLYRDLLFTSERTSSTISALRVRLDGRPGELVSATATVNQPRGFAISHDGYLIAVSETDRCGRVYQIGKDGQLQPTDDFTVGTGANWVQIIE